MRVERNGSIPTTTPFLEELWCTVCPERCPKRILRAELCYRRDLVLLCCCDCDEIPSNQQRNADTLYLIENVTKRSTRTRWEWDITRADGAYPTRAAPGAYIVLLRRSRKLVLPVETVHLGLHRPIPLRAPAMHVLPNIVQGPLLVSGEFPWNSNACCEWKICTWSTRFPSCKSTVFWRTEAYIDFMPMVSLLSLKILFEASQLTIAFCPCA